MQDPTGGAYSAPQAVFKGSRHCNVCWSSLQVDTKPTTMMMMMMMMMMKGFKGSKGFKKYPLSYRILFAADGNGRVDKTGGKGRGGEEKNGGAGEGMERKRRMLILPLLQEFLRAPMTLFHILSVALRIGFYPLIAKINNCRCLSRLRNWYKQESN